MRVVITVRNSRNSRQVAPRELCYKFLMSDRHNPIRPRCKAKVYKRDTYRYTGRGKSRLEMHYVEKQVQPTRDRHAEPASSLSVAPSARRCRASAF